MSRTYRRRDGDGDIFTTTSAGRTSTRLEKPFRCRAGREEKPFRCGHCKAMVDLVPYGGKHRNHCPYCLYSRHVDDRVMGDRASACGSAMRPVGAFVRAKGEHVIVHRCVGCGFERYNRIAADDDFDLVLGLPLVGAPSGVEERESIQEDLTA